MKIISIANHEPKFYSLLGPFLARRSVEREIGYKIYDDDDKTWFIALEGKMVVGFCYRQEKPKGSYQIGSCYVVESCRGKGVMRKLLECAMDGITGTVQLTTKSPALQKILIGDGFEELGGRGSFTRYGREIK